MTAWILMVPMEGGVLAIWSSKKLRFTAGEIHDSNKETISQSDFMNITPSVSGSYCSFRRRAWRHYGECSPGFLILQHDQGGIVLHMLGRVTLVAIGDQVGSSDPLSGCKLIQCSSIQFYLYSICYHCHCLRACSTSKSGKKNLPFNRKEPWAGLGLYRGTLLLIAR